MKIDWFEFCFVFLVAGALFIFGGQIYREFNYKCVQSHTDTCQQLLCMVYGENGCEVWYNQETECNVCDKWEKQ